MTSWTMAMDKARVQQRKAQAEAANLIYEINGVLYHVNPENGNLTRFTDEEMEEISDK